MGFDRIRRAEESAAEVSLDAIAAQTQRLAEQGNPNAMALVDELRKRGVTINTSTGAAATPQK